ncbi:outer membrane lipoprotein-sorting protein [Thiovulum sp. ES]|nr:outer membrane lipoprotein-sorting protein [Thiovulum sp. ES]
MRKFLLFTLFYLPLFGGDLANLKTLKAEFQQIVESDGKRIAYSGELYIKQPHFILWKYIKPVEKYLYLNGKKLFLLEPELEQVIIKRVDKSLKMLQILENAEKVDEKRYIAKIDERDYLIILDQVGKIKRIIYKDELDNSVSLSLFEVEENGYIPTTKFLPEIPEDFDKIYQ